MMKWLSNLFSSRQTGSEEISAAQAEEILSLQKQVQTLRLELDASGQHIANLMNEVERMRARQDQLVAETVAARLEMLLSDLAGPASQIMTQADLLENQGKPVQARDVLSVARRMVRALERHGVAFEGKIGAQELYDPNRHTPIHAGESFKSGSPVTIRFTGVIYQGKTLYKAIVE